MSARGPASGDSAVLLVHGAHFGGWCWLLVMARLARHGIHSEAVELPFTSYDDDVEHVAAAVDAAAVRRRVHVVCHSYAGLVVAAGAQRASGLTFVAGRLPLPGEVPADHTDEWGFADFQRCMVPDGAGAKRMSPAAAPYLFNRTDAALADFAMTRLRPMASVVPDRHIADPAWLSVPSSYVVCSADRAVRPDAQRDRASRVDASIELDADHCPFLSRPDALADFIATRHRELAAA